MCAGLQADIVADGVSSICALLCQHDKILQAPALGRLRRQELMTRKFQASVAGVMLTGRKDEVCHKCGHTSVRAISEGRVGKQSGCYRLQCDAYPHLLNHVCLALKI